MFGVGVVFQTLHTDESGAVQTVVGETLARVQHTLAPRRVLQGGQEPVVRRHHVVREERTPVTVTRRDGMGAGNPFFTSIKIPFQGIYFGNLIMTMGRFQKLHPTKLAERNEKVQV